MRVPLSWLRDYVDLPGDATAAGLEATFARLGIEVDAVDDLAGSVRGPLVVGRVASIEELTEFKKPIRYCQVDVGEAEPTGIVCGATNFAEGDLVVVIRPGGVLPGDFAISARKTYGRVSNGMICSARELGLGDDHAGIIVLPADIDAKPGADARPVVGLDDVVFELEITPDRGYCLSIRGLARELATAYGVPFRDPGSAPAPGATAEPAYPITVADPVGCDRFAARLVRRVDPRAASPDWLRRRLAQAGVRPISLAVDITNYVMLDLGQPMHAFDADRLTGPVVVRRAQPGERLTTLDGVDRALDPADLVICDDTGVISLAAVMGGATTEVHDSTTTVLFEAAHWDPVSVGRTARRHRLLSEASKRFERNTDPALALVALDRAVALLVEYGGGVADDGVTDIDHVRPPAAVSIPAELPGRTAGVGYSTDRVAALLTEVGCTVEVAGDRLVVTPPTWRPDLTDPADLVEEVIRLDGYDNVPSILPTAPPGSGLTPEQRRRRSVGRALAEAGYVEVLSYPFMSPEAFDKFGLPADDPRRTAMRLVNPLSEQEPLMRTTLLPPLLGTLRRNLGRGMRDLALVEIGQVIRPDGGPAGPAPELRVDARPSDEDLTAAEARVPAQPWRVAVVLTGDAEQPGWWGAGRPAGWADAVEAARTVVAAAGLPADRVAVRADRHAPWHPGRCAAIVVDGVLVGHAGELHPAVCAALELPRRTAAMELELDRLPAAGVVPAPRFSTYPPALIDVALVVDDHVPAAEVANALRTGAGDLLESVRLFDVFTGEQLGTARKSLAYKLSFRAPDRTLTVEEAVAARDAAVAEAARRYGAVLRGA